jgi:hypothetical protein
MRVLLSTAWVARGRRTAGRIPDALPRTIIAGDLGSELTT